MIRRADLRALAFLFRRFARPHTAWLLLLVGLSLVAAFLTALQPLVLAPALDVALLSNTPPAPSLSELTLNNLGPTLVAQLGLAESTSSFGVLLVVVLIFVAVVASAALLGFLNLQLMRLIRTGIANDIQADLYRRLLGLSMPFFAGRRVGDLSHRFVFDVISTAQTFDPIVKGLLESTIQIAVYGVILFRTDPTLAASVASVALVHLAITRFLLTRIRRASTDTFDAYAHVGAHVQEALQSIRIVKSFSAERFEIERLDRRLSGLKRLVLKFGLYQNSEAPLRQVADALAIGAALLVSFHALSQGRLTVAGFGLFVLVVRQTIVPFSAFNNAIVQLQQMMGASTRILEIFEARPTVVDGAEDAPGFQSQIALRGVCFEYQPGHPVLEDVSLTIPRGQVVALVGPSGAGKSTLSDLVLRLYDPTAGAVLYDRVDVRRFRQESYRRHFGVVSQEPLLFNASIEENIAYGRPVVREDVEHAARVARADEFIRQLPEGYRSTVGDRGSRLSGGQRQRIAIARAVYGRPELLVMDEATSSLDSESERLVQRAIDELLQSSTALVIAHRLSTVARADLIVVLDRGRIAASGPHALLLETSPLYRRLHEAQFQPAPSPP